MTWEEKVQTWRDNEVTQALIKDFEADVQKLVSDLLLFETDPHQVFVAQGLVRGTQACIDAITLDEITNPYK